MTRDKAVQLIHSERLRQLTDKGHTKELDKRWVNGELFQAAQVYYALGAGLPLNHKDGRKDHMGRLVPDAWPWDGSWYKPKTPILNMVRAGALAMAEEDRTGRISMGSRKLYEDSVMALERMTDPEPLKKECRLRVLARIFEEASKQQKNIIDPPFGCVPLNLKPETCLEVAKYLTAMEVLATQAKKSPDADPKTVPERLARLGDIYRERNAIYGDTYKNFGKVLVGMFPKGLAVETADDWNRLALYFHILDKMARYAGAFKAGGHVDSLDDNSVYSQMLQEFDKEVRTRA